MHAAKALLASRGSEAFSFMPRRPPGPSGDPDAMDLERHQAHRRRPHPIEGDSSPVRLEDVHGGCRGVPGSVDRRCVGETEDEPETTTAPTKTRLRDLAKVDAALDSAGI